LLSSGRDRDWPHPASARRRTIPYEGNRNIIKIYSSLVEAGACPENKILYGNSFGSFKPGIVFSIGNKDYLFLPCSWNGRNILFPISQGPGDIRIRLQRIHEEQTAYDGFYIPPSPYTADYFQSGSIGKGYKMKGIPEPEEFFKKSAAYIIQGILI
jgi:hypothetical protein